MANKIYNNAKTLLMQNELDLETDTIKVILVNSYSPDIDNEDYYSDVSAYEVNGSGYTVGGMELAGRSFVEDDLNDRTKFVASDVTWVTSNVTSNGAIIYKSTGLQGTSPLIAYIDFNGTKSTNGTDFKIEWSDEDGVIYLT